MHSRPLDGAVLKAYAPAPRHIPASSSRRRATNAAAGPPYRVLPDVKIWGEQIFAYLLTYAAVSAIISVRSDPPIYFCEHLFEKTVFRIRRVRAELKGVPAGLSGPVGAICKPKKRPKARETGTENRTYIAIDLKSFYASAECVARGLDPLSANLVVADAGRTEKTICLAV